MNQMIVDLIVTAVEGGINYWAGIVKYEEDYPNSIDVTIVDFLGEKPTPVQLTEELVQAGFDKIISGEIPLRSDILYDIALSKTTGEWEGDSDAADCVIQAAVFGDVLYS